jgi:hypothetical protein
MPGLEPAGRVGMAQGQRGVAPLPAGLQRRFSEATPDSNAAKQQPNARPELLPEVDARHERTLLAVSSRPLFGAECPTVPPGRTRATLRYRQPRPVLLPTVSSCHQRLMQARLPKTS